MSVIAKRIIVSGRVQGVFFRASTRNEAVRLGLRGSAVNLPDGRVEVLAAGSATDVDALTAWLRKGPPLASVTDILIESADPADVPDNGFHCG